MTKKILITGFPHSGTTILRAIVGKCESVYDNHIEFEDPSNYNPNSPYKFYVWKHPFLPAIIRNDGYSIKDTSYLSDTIIIHIIRNPWNTFTSLYKRQISFGEFSIFDNRNGHSLQYWENSAHRFLENEENFYKDVYTIKYEDMFLNNFQKLKNIFDSIGLEYSDETFVSNKVLKHNHSEYIENYNQTGEIGELYRMWQINQPFQNMNGEVNLPNEFSDMLGQSNLVKLLGYSDPIK
jgi:hypothetical protein